MVEDVKLDAKNISLSINGRHIVKPLSLSVSSGELVGLIGPNGAGKTSLLRILAKLQKPESGECKLDEKPYSRIRAQSFSQQVSYMEQGAPVYWPLQVRRLVELGRLPHLSPWSKLSQRDNDAIEQAMKWAEVEHLEHRTVTTLSGGERMRTFIARVFASEPQSILADEPIASLDPYHQIHTMELFSRHCERGGSAVIVLHDLNTAARFCNRLIIMHKGMIAADGTPEEILQPKILEDIYGISVDVIKNASGEILVMPKRRVSAPIDTIHSSYSTDRV